jgi:glucans biosynthesis protein C
MSTQQSSPANIDFSPPTGDKISNRFQDIDAFRAALMLIAVLLHVGTVYATNREHITGNTDRLYFFSWMVNGLHLIVTPAFFVISGFVMARMLKSRGAGAVASERAQRLIMPMASVALTFNIVEHYLRYKDAGGSLSMSAYLSSSAFARLWQDDRWSLHLWFLLILAVFVAGTLAFAAIASRDSRFYIACRRFADQTSILIQNWFGLLVLILALAAINMLFYGIAAKAPGGYNPILPGLPSLYKLAQSLPFFLFGLWLSASPKLQESIFNFRPWMMLALVLAFVAQPYPGTTGPYWYDTAMLFAQNIVCWISVIGGLQFFRRFFNKSNPLRTRWVDRAQSMFLFHHGLVYIGGTLLVLVTLPPALEFIILLVGVVATVALIHDHIIMRFSILGFLFNGRGKLRRAKPDARAILQAAE